MTKTNWHKRFMELAHHIALWSKYPGRKVGAVITDDRHTVVSVGYNGSPRGCNDNDETKYDKKTKYLYAEHAERNAIYNAATPLIGKTIYSTLFPCAACARAIIQCGITRLVSYAPDFNDEAFGVQFKAALKMFQETNILVVYLDPTTKETICCETCKNNEEYWKMGGNKTFCGSNCLDNNMKNWKQRNQLKLLAYYIDRGIGFTNYFDSL